MPCIVQHYADPELSPYLFVLSHDGGDDDGDVDDSRSGS